MKTIRKAESTTVLFCLSAILFVLVSPNQASSGENDELIKKYIAMLTSTDKATSKEAKESLLKLGEEIVPYLAEKLKDANYEKRNEVVLLLGDLGPKSEKAVPSLIDILETEMQKKNSTWILIANAAGTLGKIGPSARTAIPSLIDTMKTDGSNWVGDWDSAAKVTAIDVIRGNAISALGEIGIEAVPLLVKEIEHNKELGILQNQIRKNAANALYCMGEPVIPEIIHYLREAKLSAETKSWLLAVLGWFGPKAQSAIGRLIEMIDHSTPEMLTDVLRTLKKVTGEDFGKDSQAWKTWAEARKLIDQENFDQAIVVCKQSLDKNPKDGKMLLLLGIAYYQKAQFDDALSSFNQVIEVDPNRAEAYFQRGLTFAFRPERDIEKAMADFTKAIELDPRHSKAYLNRGNLYAMKSLWEKALEDFSKALELDPKNAAAYYNRGMIYDRTGDIEKAIGDYSKTIGIDPNHVKAHLNRGSAYAEKEELEKARKDFQKVLELDPNGRAGGIARDNLSKIK